MGPTILFTHLKIILLQCFQFSVFSNNKLNPNGPYIYYKIKKSKITIKAKKFCHNFSRWTSCRKAEL